MVQKQIVFDEEYIKRILVNGLFFAVLGETGSGKTITLTWFAYWINRRIINGNMSIGLFSNYHFKGDYWNYKFMEHPDELLEIRDGFAFCDDMWRWCLDSYENSRKALKKYDDLQATGRKKGICVFASSQRFKRLERNFRDNIHYIILPKVFYDRLNEPCKVYIAINSTFSEKKEYEFFYNPKPVFDMYETREEISKFDDMRKLDFNKLSKEFLEWNTETVGKESFYKMKINQSLVDLFLMDEKKIFYEFTENERKALRMKILRMM